MPPAFTNASRRLRLRQRPARHLHHHSHDGRLQDLEAKRHRGQRRRPRRRRTLTIELGGTDRDRSASRPRRRWCRRRAASDRSPSPPKRSRTCRSRTAASCSSRRSAPGVTGTRPRRRSLVDGRQQQQHHDGRRLDDGHRQQSVLLQMNVESIAEVKVLVSNYQAEYGRSSGVQMSAVTKSGTNRFRGSAYDVTRKADWNSNSETNILNGDPKAKLKRRISATRSAVRSASRAATTSCSSSTRTSTRRAPPAATSCASASRPRSSGPATSRRASTTTATSSRSIKDPLSSSAVHRDQHRGLLPVGGVIGRIPADRLYQTGLNILKLYPMPNVPAGARYNYELVRPAGEAARQPAGGPPRLPAVAEAARHVQVLRLVAAGRDDSRHHPGLERHAAIQPVRAHAGDHGELLAEQPRRSSRAPGAAPRTR